MSSEQDELSDRDYPIQEDMGFQEKLWKLERAGWVALSLVVAITLLGVFGAVAAWVGLGRRLREYR